jgi:hypothetical protein
LCGERAEREGGRHRGRGIWGAAAADGLSELFSTGQGSCGQR